VNEPHPSENNAYGGRMAGSPGRDRILECAIELFARKGPDATTMRDIAALAGVSPALIVHHFESKRGLIDAVDTTVTAVIMNTLDKLQVASSAQQDPNAPHSGVADVMAARFPPGSPIPDYMARMLLSGDARGHELFHAWFSMARATLDNLIERDLAHEPRDRDARAMSLMSNGLAQILLRRHVEGAIGTDPVEPEGSRRWAADMMDVYVNGALKMPPSV
jgi:AcrR family transcriptional regulator